MAINTGSLIAAPIRPVDSNDPIATAFSNEIKGGHHQYQTLNERNAIISNRRDWGMLVTVYNDPNPTNNKTYQLQYLYVDNVITNNSNWVTYNTGGGNSSTGEWINSVISLTGSTPATASNGDRYLVDTIAFGIWVGNENKIAEWNISNNTWSYTLPSTSMAVMVDNRPGSIYRYNGSYPTGTWSRERISQIQYGNASGNGYSYSVSLPIYTSYVRDNVIICQFGTNSLGGTTSLNINNIGYKTIKKNFYGELKNIEYNDIVVGMSYQLLYDGTQLQLINPSFAGSQLQIKTTITNESLVIPQNYQYLVYGDLTLNGTTTLVNYGSLVTINGDLIIGTDSSFVNFGTYEAPLLLQKLKYAATQSFNANQTYSIYHNLDSSDIIYTFRDSTGNVLSPGLLSVTIPNDNLIVVSSTSTQSNIRVTIIS